MSKHQIKFLILRTVKFGEADLMVTGITPQGNKVSHVARGALKSKKRFSGGVLQATHFIEATCISAKSEDRPGTLSEANLIEDFEGLRDDYDRLQLGIFIVNSVAKLAQEGSDENPALFNLTGHALRAASKAMLPDLLRLHFVVRLLQEQGVLDREDWMNPYLHFPLSKHNELAQALQSEGRIETDSARNASLAEQLEYYFRNAGTRG